MVRDQKYSMKCSFGSYGNSWTPPLEGCRVVFIGNELIWLVSDFEEKSSKPERLLWNIGQCAL